MRGRRDGRDSVQSAECRVQRTCVGEGERGRMGAKAVFKYLRVYCIKVKSGTWNLNRRLASFRKSRALMFDYPESSGNAK